MKSKKEKPFESSRGALKSLSRHAKPMNNWFIAKKGKHSQKPEEARQIIEYCYPNSTKIELFARQKIEGWDCWGNEIDSDIEIPQE